MLLPIHHIHTLHHQLSIDHLLKAIVYLGSVANFAASHPVNIANE